METNRNNSSINRSLVDHNAWSQKGSSAKYRDMTILTDGEGHIVGFSNSKKKVTMRKTYTTGDQAKNEAAKYPSKEFTMHTIDLYLFISKKIDETKGSGASAQKTRKFVLDANDETIHIYGKGSGQNSTPEKFKTNPFADSSSEWEDYRNTFGQEGLKVQDSGKENSTPSGSSASPEGGSKSTIIDEQTINPDRSNDNSYDNSYDNPYDDSESAYDDTAYTRPKESRGSQPKPEDSSLEDQDQEETMRGRKRAAEGRDNSDEVENLRRRNSELEENLYRSSEENKRIKDDHEDSERELRSLRDRTKDLTDHLEELSHSNKGLSKLTEEKELELNNLKEHLESLEDASSNDTDRLRQLEGHMDTLKDDLDIKRDELGKLNQEISSHKRNQEDASGEIGNLNEHIDSIKADLEDAERTKRELKDSLEEARVFMGKMNDLIDSEATPANNMDKETILRNVENTIRESKRLKGLIEALEEKASSLKKDNDDMTKDISKNADTQKEKENIEKQLKSFKEEYGKLKLKQEAVSIDLKSESDKNKKLLESLDDTTKKAVKIKESLDHANRKTEDLSDKLTKSEEEVVSKNKHNEELESQISILKDTNQKIVQLEEGLYQAELAKTALTVKLSEEKDSHKSSLLSEKNSVKDAEQELSVQKKKTEDIQKELSDLKSNAKRMEEKISSLEEEGIKSSEDLKSEKNKHEDLLRDSEKETVDLKEKLSKSNAEVDRKTAQNSELEDSLSRFMAIKDSVSDKDKKIAELEVNLGKAEVAEREIATKLEEEKRKHTASSSDNEGKLSKASEELNTQKKKTEDVQQELSDANSMASSLKETIKNLETEKNKEAETLKDTEGKNETLVQSVQDRDKAIETAKLQLASSEQKIKDLEEKSSNFIKSSEQDTSDHNKIVDELTNQKSSLSNKVTDLEAEISSLKLEKEKEITELNNHVMESDSQLQSKMQEIEQMTTDLSVNLDKIKAGHISDLDILKDSVSKLEKSVDDKQSKYLSVSAELQKTTEEMKSSSKESQETIESLKNKLSELEEEKTDSGKKFIESKISLQEMESQIKELNDQHKEDLENVLKNVEDSKSDLLKKDEELIALREDNKKIHILESDKGSLNEEGNKVREELKQVKSKLEIEHQEKERLSKAHESHVRDADLQKGEWSAKLTELKREIEEQSNTSEETISSIKQEITDKSKEISDITKVNKDLEVQLRDAEITIKSKEGLNVFESVDLSSIKNILDKIVIETQYIEVSPETIADSYDSGYKGTDEFIFEDEFADSSDNYDDADKILEDRNIFEEDGSISDASAISEKIIIVEQRIKEFGKIKNELQTQRDALGDAVQQISERKDELSDRNTQLMQENAKLQREIEAMTIEYDAGLDELSRRFSKISSTNTSRSASPHPSSKSESDNEDEDDFSDVKFDDKDAFSKIDIIIDKGVPATDLKEDDSTALNEEAIKDRQNNIEEKKEISVFISDEEHRKLAEYKLDNTENIEEVLKFFDQYSLSKGEQNTVLLLSIVKDNIIPLGIIENTSPRDPVASSIVQSASALYTKKEEKEDSSFEVCKYQLQRLSDCWDNMKRDNPRGVAGKGDAVDGYILEYTKKSGTQWNRDIFDELLVKDFKQLEELTNSKPELLKEVLELMHYIKGKMATDVFSIAAKELENSISENNSNRNIIGLVGGLQKKLGIPGAGMLSEDNKGSLGGFIRKNIRNIPYQYQIFNQSSEIAKCSQQFVEKEILIADDNIDLFSAIDSQIIVGANILEEDGKADISLYNLRNGTDNWNDMSDMSALTFKSVLTKYKGKNIQIIVKNDG